MGNTWSNPAPDHAGVLERTTSTVKHGHYLPSTIGFVPWGYHSSALESIKVAEAEMGRAPTAIEVCQVHKRISYFPTIPGLITFTINNLWRNDEVLTDRELTRVSVNPKL